MRCDTYLTRVADTSMRLIDQVPMLEQIIIFLRVLRENGGTLFVCGNGGSAGTASHTACDLFKTSGLRAVSLNENMPLTSAIINDEGWKELYSFQLKRLFREGDALMCFSVHGGSGSDKAGRWSQNLLRAIQYVKAQGGRTIGFSGFTGGRMRKLCDYSVVVPVDSTPVVESLHVVLEHLMSFMLQEDNRK